MNLAEVVKVDVDYYSLDHAETAAFARHVLDFCIKKHKHVKL